MTLPEKAIDQFKEIYLKEFGIELSQVEAARKAIDLFNLFKILLRLELDKRQDNGAL